MKNQEIAEIFYEIADILEIQGVQWKPNAYRKAAQNIEALSEDIVEVYKKGKLMDIPGVGENISKKIEEIIKTGKLRYFKELKKEVPVELEKLMSIPEVGPKTAKLLYDKLKIKNIQELKKAIKEHKLRGLKGIGEKTEQDILEGMKIIGASKKRHLLGFILPTAVEIENKLKSLPEVNKISLAGSIRRRKETIRDIDILVSTNNPNKVVNLFTKMEDVKKVLAKGSTKASVKLKSNIQVDIRVISDDIFGSALQYFTGSKEHSIKLRRIAIKKGYKLSEYGLFKGSRIIAGKKEVDVYKRLGLSYIEPELREDQGEIEAALKNKLPKLVSKVNGDLHVHTKWSDGSDTIEEIAKAAKDRGYRFLAICDHAGKLKIAHSLDGKRLLKQITEIDKLNKRLSDFVVLKGAEVDVNKDGSLAIDNNLLKKLDVVTASVHSGFKSSENDMTDRIIKAMENPFVNIVGHPTGRILQRRNPYAVNLERLFDAAKDNKVAMEINAFPDRLDLNDINAKAAKNRGVKLAIGTDSHTKDQLHFIELGIAVARRGWCSSKDILNCLSYNKLMRWFEK